MLQLNKEQLQTLYNACNMARAEYNNKIATLPIYQHDLSYEQYMRHRQFPYKDENEIRWGNEVHKVEELMKLIEKELNLL